MKQAEVDVAVIGGGGAGLVAAAGCAALGARTALIERARLGGECTWTGCVPSKALLHIAHTAARTRRAGELGLRVDGFDVDFEAVMNSVRTTRQLIYDNGESPAYLKTLGIRTLRASVRFLDGRTIRIERAGRSRDINFRSAIIATGSRPRIPNIPGLESVGYLTSESLFEIDRLPARLAILGGGAIGVEMAQAFARLGSQVTLICRSSQILPGTEAGAADLLQSILQQDGVDIHLRSAIASVRRDAEEIVAEISSDGGNWHMRTDQLLIATGRSPNTGSLDLEAAGVAFDASGIAVDRYCRTNVRHILAVGDVTPGPNQTHIGENMAKAAAINAMARLPIAKHETRVIPQVIYTDPEIAAVGETWDDLDHRGARFDTIEFPFEKIDRAVLEHNMAGFVRIHHRLGKVLGATIAGPQAGEMIAEYALSMRHGLSLQALSTTMHAYPTMMLGARRAADQALLRAVKPWMVRGFQLLHGYRGEIPAYVGTRTIV